MSCHSSFVDAHANAKTGDKTIALREHCSGELKMVPLAWIICKGIARTLKKLRTSKGDNWIKQ